MWRRFRQHPRRRPAAWTPLGAAPRPGPAHRRRRAADPRPGAPAVRGVVGRV